MAPQRKWNAFENAACSPKGVTDYALLNGEWPRFTSNLRNSLAGAVEVFKLPLGDLITRQQSVLSHPSILSALLLPLVRTMPVLLMWIPIWDSPSPAPSPPKQGGGETVLFSPPTV